MFFDVCIILVALLQPFYIYAAYRAGKGQDVSFKPIFCNKRDREYTKEEKQQLLEWQNILNYDGTKESQEERDW